MWLLGRLHEIIYVKYQLLSIIIANNIENKGTRMNEALWAYGDTTAIDLSLNFFFGIFIF